MDRPVPWCPFTMDLSESLVSCGDLVRLVCPEVEGPAASWSMTSRDLGYIPGKNGNELYENVLDEYVTRFAEVEQWAKKQRTGPWDEVANSAWQAYHERR